ncbi:hypothetical protein [Larkinella soli]|uniref:hypothetical protein n=1 Tax=Larkinella soli TaxID=1770527 RepID=UPI000FFBCC43|nr:hypothetical protein [Larkinella soli]
MKRNVLQLAWRLIKQFGLDRKTALLQAWKTCKVKVKLQNTDERGMWVHFRKVNGEETYRLVTRTLSHIPADQLPKNSKVDGVTVPCYDLFKGAWISFRADLLIAA